MSAEKGKNDQSFVAVDEFEFLQTEICEFKPDQAIPTEPPTTPTPTEPPGRKYKLTALHQNLPLPLLSIHFDFSCD